MNESVVKKTQEALGKVIKKPPLTEKLLSKPPFRYLHDIFNEIIRTTGFMKGLYKDSELKSDNVKDKETKIAFLQKAIDVVILVSGEPLAAKPARIVAGHEPEKTNELLQAIAKCCLNKLSSEEAVKRILSGEKVDSKIKAPTKSQDKENREGREHRPVERQEEKRIERSGSREDKDPDQRRERGRQHRDGERDHRHDRERSGKNQRREPDRAKDAEQDKSRERARDKDKDKGRAKDRDKEKDKEPERDQDKSRDRDGMRERESVRRDPERSRDKRRERDKEAETREDKNRSQEREIHSKDRISDGQQKPTEDEPRKTAKPVPSEPEPATEPAGKVDAQSDSPARIPRPSSAKGQRRKPRLAGQDESDSEGNADPPKESGDAAGASFPPETPSSNKRMARPSSARAAPPRVKKQESLNDGVPAERLSSAKSSVIREGKKRSDDDEDEEDEQFLVADAAPEPAEAQEKEYAQDLTGEEKHGGLVKKILETKKDFEPAPSSTKSKEKPVSGEALKKEQDLVTREVERLRASIQSVCQSALPLGKIMDYVQEDIDAMQAELQGWRRENKEHAQALLQEQKATDWALEPLKAELYELDQMIKDYQDKICAVRSNILRNEETIQKKLTGIISSST